MSWKWSPPCTKMFSGSVMQVHIAVRPPHYYRPSENTRWKREVDLAGVFIISKAIADSFQLRTH